MRRLRDASGCIHAGWVGPSGSGKANTLMNLINNQPAIGKVYLYAKDPYETKY